MATLCTIYPPKLKSKARIMLAGRVKPQISGLRKHLEGSHNEYRVSAPRVRMTTEKDLEILRDEDRGLDLEILTTSPDSEKNLKILTTSSDLEKILRDESLILVLRTRTTSTNLET
ncbi:hypothetical protein E4U50_008300 [Claviceps purpurea]|nr:hypothetical protein E4U37_008256 [Claviceps purpurea]KAG6196278.1 hypothetical protein E4U50_008300 [Claviceps purpurea]